MLTKARIRPPPRRRFAASKSGAQAVKVRHLLTDVITRARPGKLFSLRRKAVNQAGGIAFKPRALALADAPGEGCEFPRIALESKRAL